MDDLAKKLNIRDPEGWYKISKSQLQRNGGSALLQKYHERSKLLMAVYPEYPWSVTRFKAQLSSGYWSHIKNQRAFVDGIAKKLGIKEQQDWCQITVKYLQQQGAYGLLKRYNYSPSKLLATLYPEYKQMCRAFVTSIVQEYKLSQISDVLTIPTRYPYSSLGLLQS